MSGCNDTTMRSQINVAVSSYIFNSIGILGSVFLIVVIRRTPSLKGFSRTMLLNEQVACLLEEITSIAVFTSGHLSIHVLDAFFTLAKDSLKNVSLMLLFAINANLYLAICMNTRYRTLVTRRRVMVVVVFSWFFSAAVGMAGLFHKDYFKMDCDFLVLVPNPTASSIWRICVFMLEECIILVGNITCLYKIIHRRASVQPDISLRAVSDTEKKVKLAKCIFFLCTFYTSTFLILNVMFYIKAPLDGSSVDNATMLRAAIIINRFFTHLRPCFYLPLYKPMRDTAKKLLCSCRQSRRHVITVQAVSSSHSDARPAKGDN